MAVSWTQQLLEVTGEMRRAKSDVITFKADEALRIAMAGVPNRSEFIRQAILSALESACPLCRGTGILSPRQKDHWDRFAHTHSIEECGNCHETHIVCLEKQGGKSRHKCRTRPSRAKRSAKKD